MISGSAVMYSCQKRTMHQAGWYRYLWKWLARPCLWFDLQSQVTSTRHHYLIVLLTLKVPIQYKITFIFLWPNARDTASRPITRPPTMEPANIMRKEILFWSWICAHTQSGTHTHRNWQFRCDLSVHTVDVVYRQHFEFSAFRKYRLGKWSFCYGNSYWRNWRNKLFCNGQ